MKSAVTLATVTTEFLERPGLAPSTRETYELTLGLLLQKYGSWSIEIISKQTLVEYLNNLSHLKYTTHHKHQAILQSLLNFAVEQGYIKSNPIRGLKQRLPEREKGEHKSDDTIKYLTQSQLNILYAAVKDDLRLSAIVYLLHRTGCRIGELLALNIDSVDIKNQKFQVLGKGNKQRWCYYSDDAASALAKYLKYSRHKNTDALLTAQHPVTLKVSRISYHTLYDYWRETTNKYPQLQLCRIHDLRHTFATERVGLISIEELCSLMGHESIQTTLRLSNQSKKWIDDFLKEKASDQELDDTTPVNHDKQLNNPGDTQLSQQLDNTNNSEINTDVPILTWAELKTDPGRIGVESFQKEVAKLEIFEQLELPADLFKKIPTKVLQVYKSRVIVEHPRDLRRHPEHIRYTLFTAFCWLRSQEVIDNLVELLIQIVHRISANAEKRVDKELIQDFKRVHGKNNLLYQMAEASLKTPDGTIKDVIFPVVSEVTLKNLVKEYKSTGNAYREKVYTVMRSSYGGYYRRILPLILNKLEFRSNNEVHRPVIQAIALLKKYADSKQRYYDPGEDIPIDGVLRSGWQEIILETGVDDEIKVNRINYELSVLQALREKLRCKEIWVVGANRYRNPEEDLPADFEAQRLEYFQALKQPSDVEVFIANLQQSLEQSLTLLDKGIPKNNLVTLKTTGKSRICVSPLNPQNEPVNLTRLKTEITRRWRMTSLLDILKETDLRVKFSQHFQSVSTREVLSNHTLQKRLLLCLYGLGTNTGLKRLSDEIKGDNYQDLLHVKRHFIQKEQLRNAIACVANAIFTARISTIWGEGTTACASDSKKFGAWDQNLMTEWHIRYGGRGVMIYWHVEKNSVCIYSQLKTCSSSEVAAMIEGLLRHCTEMKVETNYVDSHGQNEVAFAFCHLLGFQLMPRLKRINVQKLYRPSTGNNDAYPNLQPILTRAINWDLIRQQYDQMVKYATALRLGMAETEAILKRFTRGNLLHPTYQALAELGKAVKTIFLCKYLHSVELRQEINAGLNVVENWNSANSFIFYGKGGEIATNRLSDQELAVLSLHLLQISLVYINTLMIQQVLSQPQWMKLMKLEDLRALSPLIWGHVNPYGTFRLDLNVRLPIETG